MGSNPIAGAIFIVTIVNKTEFDLDRIETIIRFTRPPKIVLPRFYLCMTKTVCFYGYYDFGLNKVYVSLGPDDCYPVLVHRSTKAKRQGYLSGFNIEDREEALVYTLAHELRHAYQHAYPYSERLGGKFLHRVYSECDSDTYALWKLKNWRKRKTQ